MKNRKIIVLSIMIIVLIGLIVIYITKDRNNKIQNKNISGYGEKVNKLAESEMNNEQEKPIISLVEKEMETEENTIHITNKDIEVTKILDTEEGERDRKEIAIETKIYAREAQKMGITLSEDKIKEIEWISSSDEVLAYISDGESTKENFQKRIYNYLLEKEYEKLLKNRILEEVDNNKISIENETINSKMNEYVALKNHLAEKKNLTEEERKKYFVEISSLYYEIKDLYLNAIKDKYIVKFE